MQRRANLFIIDEEIGLFSTGVFKTEVYGNCLRRGEFKTVTVCPLLQFVQLELELSFNRVDLALGPVAYQEIVNVQGTVYI